jgi:hypothetical protein
MLGIAAGARFSSRLAPAAALALAAALFAPTAGANPGYAPDPVKPSIDVASEAPHGVAVDQASQDLYVAEVITSQFSGGPGKIEQFDPNGVPTANSPFATGTNDFFTGVAVNPVNQDVYGYQTELVSPFGTFGSPRLNTFSPTGAMESSFVPAKATGPQLAADASGRIYFPNDNTDTVQVFDSTGTVLESIACAGCPGGAFSEPTSVALDSAANLYVVDLANDGRVVKFKLSAGSYVYDSVLQSGAGAAAVGVDPATSDVFVGDFADGLYRVVAYNSSGVQFDDFGGGILSVASGFGTIASGQIAVNATTHKVYVVSSGDGTVKVFDRVASIPPPTASTTPASSVGQLEATLKSTVNPEGHGLLDCHFEYTGDADFQVNGFANATSVPCPINPVGSENAVVSVQRNGLTPGSTYDYRIVATSNGGTAEGTPQAFTTLPPLPPDATTGAGSAIAQTKATIAGTVNPRGGPISDCHLEYVKDATFQVSGFGTATSAPCSVKPSGTTAIPVSAKISGLTANTTYRFRVVATNNSGTTKATDQTFTTLPETCATNPTLCPVEEQPSPPVSSPPTQPSTPTPETTTPTQKPLRCRKGFVKKRVAGKAKCVKVKKHKRHPR